MLRRRPIRTKMLAAFGLFLAIVCALAFSGFWGLYRYRSLANAVSRHAAEIPDAHDLYRWAETLRDGNNRIAVLQQEERGMIESLRVGDTLGFEESTYDHTLFVLKESLRRYQDRVKTRQDQSMLVDTTKQLISLRDIQSALDDLTRTRLMPDDELTRARQVKHDLLVQRTDNHLELISSSMRQFSDDVAGQYRTWIGVFWSCIVGAVAMVTVLGLMLRSHVVKPFRTLLDGSRLVARGQFGHRIDLGTGDELSELAEAMNQMSDRFQKAYEGEKKLNAVLDQQVKDRTREVIQNEQLASVGFLAAGVAHEINNPLATIAWSAESLESRFEEIGAPTERDISIDHEFIDAMRTNLRRIQDEAFRCKGITERLLDFSRLGEVSKTHLNLGELVNEVVSMVGKVGKYRCKTLTNHIDANVFAHVNAHEIRQVVLNLVTNALESVDSDGAVDVYVRNHGPHASVCVRDNGCGMNDEVLAHLFEPFFTRRRDGTGTGLGLSITYRIVSQHHGSLTAHSEGEGHGSRLEMLLPVEAEASDSPATTPNNLEWNHESSQAA